MIESVFDRLVKVLDTNFGWTSEEPAEEVASKIMDTLSLADVVPWSWLEDFADESWASSGVYRFLIKAKEAYKRDRT